MRQPYRYPLTGPVTDPAVFLEAVRTVACASVPSVHGVVPIQLQARRMLDQRLDTVERNASTGPSPVCDVFGFGAINAQRTSRPFAGLRCEQTTVMLTSTIPVRFQGRSAVRIQAIRSFPVA